MSLFEGPNELVDHLFLHERDRAPDRAALPLSRSALAELLGAAYGASLATEEGCWPRFHMFAPTQEIEPEISFDEPVRLTSVAALKKLAPAVPPDRGALLVQEEDGVPVAQGIMSIGRRGIRVLPELKYSSGFYSMGVYISVESPGAVTLTDFRSSPGRLMRLEKGGLTQPAELSSCLRWWQALGDVRAEVQRRELPLSRDQSPLYNDLLRDVWNRVLVGVAALGHGGAFVMPTADGIIDELLAETTKARRVTHREGGLAKAVWKLIRTPPKNEEAMERVLDAEENLKLLVAKLVHLSAVDGCVVLDSMMSPVAFGAEIIGRSEVDRAATCVRLEPQVGAAEAEEVNVDLMGTRHRSAVRLCARFPAYAFVVSQDGDVRLIMHRRPGVAGLCGPLVASLIGSPLATW